MRTTLGSLVILASLAVSSTHAGIFDRKPKAPPQPPPADAMQKQAERVFALLNQLQNEKNENKREDAAEKLSEMDAQMFPEIVPTLAQIALKDASAGVRREAVKSLGKIKPTSKEAADALEQATKDESYWVRWQARSAKLGYKVAETPQAPPVPPQGGPVIKVPPAGPDGRLTPVPIPSAAPPAELQPAGSKEEPAKPGKVSLSKPKSMPPQDGPILVPPVR
jgi:hypothetical protein